MNCIEFLVNSLRLGKYSGSFCKLGVCAVCLFNSYLHFSHRNEMNQFKSESNWCGKLIKIDKPPRSVCLKRRKCGSDNQRINHPKYKRKMSACVINRNYTWTSLQQCHRCDMWWDVHWTANDTFQRFNILRRELERITASYESRTIDDEIKNTHNLFCDLEVNFSLWTFCSH